jgi:hypothetical protein
VTAVALLAACGGSDAKLRLDGSPRVPDDEGVATVITRTRIQLDGKRSYGVDPKFVSFSTYDGQLEPMVIRRNQYVQLGVRGHTAIWMAGVAAVVPLPAPSVYYIGRLKRVDGDRLIFWDGTVLTRRHGLAAPKPVRADGRRVEARLDPKTHRVVELT